MQPLLIFQETPSPRFTYIIRQLFGKLYRVNHEIVTDREAFRSYKGPKFSYSRNPLGSELFFACASLLYEKSIKGQQLQWLSTHKVPGLFPVYHKQSCLDYDPFAAAFYFMSRYEEYLPYASDQHGRFVASQSHLFQKGLLEIPVVNHWFEAVVGLIKQRFPEFKTAERSYRFIPTYDIDAAWAFKHKGFFRTTGAYINDLYKGNFTQLKQRTLALRNLQQDPFDTFDLMIDWQKKYRLAPIFFILFADYGIHDKNISIRNKYFIRLIKRLGDYAELGIHPSYASFNSAATLEKELTSLERSVHWDIVKSRQHFLRMSLPHTYRNLISMDIKEDYTMGFAAQAGFRAGIADPYNFYDLEMEKETSLLIVPFAVMDGTLKDYLDLDVESAEQKVYELNKSVREVSGTFVTLWHNESLSDTYRWEGWQDLYKRIIEFSI